jgi:zinc D-Ala-D-Ala carboxypeptidase
MRPDVGIATIAQRLAGLRAAAPRPPTPAAGPAGGFADLLDAELAAQQPAAAAGAPAAGSAGVLLGRGARWTTTPGVIAPAAPGAAGVHSCPDCAPAAVQPLAAGTATTAAQRTGPPPELQAYGNGRIPPEALAPLGVGDHRLWAPAAAAFQALAAAAARDGVTIGVNSSYRDLAGQQAMVDRYGLYSQGGRAAAPGSSNHGWGLSLDLQLDDRAQAWMRANAGAFGFREDVPREPWHWTFTGG